MNTALAQDARDVSAPALPGHIDLIESDAIYILREVAAQFENPALLFSGGKDSAVVLHLARRAFYPGRIPFTLLHVDTGHNYPEVLEFRDRAAAAAGARLEVRSVEDSIAQGRVILRNANESRNAHQSVTLLDAIEELKFDACIGGARRDEEKARAKERVFSFRDAFGAWDPGGNGRSFGISIMAPSDPAKTCASSPSAIGPRPTSGDTSHGRTSNCPPCILPMTAMWSNAITAWCPSTP